MICRNCGAEFEPKKRGRKNSRFCSHKCSDTWRQHDIYDLMPKKYEKQCAFCGKSFQTNSEGQKYCSTKCSHDVRKTGRTVYTKKCLYCNEEFKTIHKGNKYCTSVCASRHAADLRRGEYFCEYCGKPRYSDHPNRNRFCSRECATKARSLSALLRKQERKRLHAIEMTRQCDYCGNPFIAVSTANHFCSYECYYNSALTENHNKNVQRFRPEQRTCQQCGTVFTTTFERQSATYCSDKCSKKHQKKAYKKRRQKQLIENYVEPVELQSTYHNYGGVCGICGLPVPERNDPASDWGPTVDHIKPLSLGGLHQQSNCQLAHRLCNSLKLDTTDVFKINWREKLIDEPGRWNARLDALWKQLGLFGCEKEPTRITIQPSTTIRAGL